MLLCPHQEEIFAKHVCISVQKAAGLSFLFSPQPLLNLPQYLQPDTQDVSQHIHPSHPKPRRTGGPNVSQDWYVALPPPPFSA